MGAVGSGIIPLSVGEYSPGFPGNIGRITSTKRSGLWSVWRLLDVAPPPPPLVLNYYCNSLNTHSTRVSFTTLHHFNILHRLRIKLFCFVFYLWRLIKILIVTDRWWLVRVFAWVTTQCDVSSRPTAIFFRARRLSISVIGNNFKITRILLGCELADAVDLARCA